MTADVGAGSPGPGRGDLAPARTGIRIKICGIRDPEHALAAAEAGADYIGMIFYPPAGRYVPPAEARRIADAMKGLGPKLVGVFVNQTAEAINATAEFCGLDLVQLSGDEPWGFCHDLSVPAIKALRVSAATCVDDVVEELDRELPGHQGLCLMESRVEGAFGGTGHTMDWALAAAAAQKHQFLLAGGLDPENVGGAVARVRPWGVDVSSGVETAGRKDPEKIRAFIKAVREA